jgi:hypothetical protein
VELSDWRVGRGRGDPGVASYEGGETAKKFMNLNLINVKNVKNALTLASGEIVKVQNIGHGLRGDLKYGLNLFISDGYLCLRIWIVRENYPQSVLWHF